MLHADFTEDILRDDLATAARALDEARDKLRSEHLTAEESQAKYRAAFLRYGAALRRFRILLSKGNDWAEVA